MQGLEEIARISVDCGFHLHRDIGPGLLEFAYEILLFESLKDKGLSVERQKIIPITFKGRVLDEAFRADLIVEKRLHDRVEVYRTALACSCKTTINLFATDGLAIGFPDEFWRSHFQRRRQTSGK